jgi:hypothetical protein
MFRVKMEAQFHNPEDHNMDLYCSENLKSHIDKSYYMIASQKVKSAVFFSISSLLYVNNV